MSQVSDRQEKREVAHSFLFRHGTPVTEIERTVWEAFKSGNRKALDYIFEKYIRLLFAYGSKITKDQGLVEDCIQDVFVELWHKHKVISSTDNIKLYLLKSLRRKIIRTLAINNRIHVDPLDEQRYENELEFSAEFHLIQAQASIEQHGQLKNALSQLSKRQREAVYLKFYEHFTYAEIADMMNLTVKSAYKLIGKAIDSLRKHIRLQDLI